MAKKSRRRRSAGRAPVTRQAPPPLAAPRPSAAPPAQAPATRSPDLAEEYRYVVSDLKRIGVLAGVMFAVLVALALVAQNAL